VGVKQDHKRYSKHVTKTRRWQAVRHAVLERDGWACVDCGERRRLEVDHRQPVRTAPELSFDPANCQTLCGPCHSRKTRIEIGHAPLPKPRQDWRDSVQTLMREGKQTTEHEENNDA
jgi:5-methylcytosine-specific restriction endonuclease McrA